MNKNKEFCRICPNFGNCSHQAGSYACRLCRVVDMETEINNLFRLVVKYKNPETYHNPNTVFNIPPYPVCEAAADRQREEISEFDSSNWNECDQKAAAKHQSNIDGYKKSLEIENEAA